MVAKNGNDDFCWPVFLPEIMEKKNVLYQEFQVLGIYCSCDLCAKPGDSQPSLYKWRLVAGNAFQIWSTVLYFLPGELRSSGVEIWREN